jgi:hypothetical protein
VQTPPNHPPDQVFQTNLNLVFVLENHSDTGLKIPIMKTGPKSAWLFRGELRLTDSAGKEVPGGFVATENFAGGRERQELVVAAKTTVTVPNYRAESFQIRRAGTYTLTARGRVLDEEGVWHPCEAEPVKFVVE